MAIAHRIDGEVVELRVAGRFPVTELLEGFEGMLADEGLPCGALVLIDVSASEEFPPRSVIQRIAAVLRSGRERLGPRLAVLVAHPARFGIARQLAVWLEEVDLACRPFYDRGTALEWLRSSGSDEPGSSRRPTS